MTNDPPASAPGWRLALRSTVTPAKRRDRVAACSTGDGLVVHQLGAAARHAGEVANQLDVVDQTVGQGLAGCRLGRVRPDYRGVDTATRLAGPRRRPGRRCAGRP